MKLDTEKCNYYMACKQKSIADIVTDTGLSRNTIARALKGEETCRPKTLGSIAKSLDIELVQILSEK